MSSIKTVSLLLFILITSESGIAAGEPRGAQGAGASQLTDLLAGFRWGSYGRAGLSWDLGEGSRARSLNVVTHGPRLEEPSYLELDLGYELQRLESLSFQLVSTVAFLEDLFHYTGKFEAQVALRNLYVEFTHVIWPELSLWVGSRMYRGDDIYVLDFWPLDHLNTLGGGVGVQLSRTRLDFHAGVNRLDQFYQHQVMLVPDPRFGAEEVEVLDRQHTIFSVKGTHELPRLRPWLSLKARVYGELHYLPAGVLHKELEREELPADAGWVAGVQLGAQGYFPHNFVNLWFRAGGGLGAYDALEVPFGLDLEKKTRSARDLVLALNVNYERGWLGVMGGGYLRYFQDADGVASDPDDGWEYVLAVRPHLYLHRHLQQVFELSYQGRRPDGLDPRTQTHLVPGLAKFSIMPTLSWDRGTYTRPQLRLIYTLTYLDMDSRRMFPAEDPRHGVAVHHFLGLQAEWWFNSSYR